LPPKSIILSFIYQKKEKEKKSSPSHNQASSSIPHKGSRHHKFQQDKKPWHICQLRGKNLTSPLNPWRRSLLPERFLLMVLASDHTGDGMKVHPSSRASSLYKKSPPYSHSTRPFPRKHNNNAIK